LSSATAASGAVLDVEHQAPRRFNKGQNRRTGPYEAQRLSKYAPSKNARLNMTTPPRMRDLAHCLLAYEVVPDKTREPAESATLRVYEKLRRGLGEVAGTAGFQSLASRALALARTEAPSLNAARVAADGSLQGLVEFEHQMDIDRDRADESATGEAGIILIARLIGLLLLFLGEALTLSLLRVNWPGVALADCSSENGRKA
jgi:hypothetical protein